MSRSRLTEGGSKAEGEKNVEVGPIRPIQRQSPWPLVCRYEDILRSPRVV